MNNYLKAFFALLVIAGLIAFGLLLPSDSKVEKDSFVPNDIVSNLEFIGPVGPEIPLETLVDVQTFQTPYSKILAGKIRLDNQYGEWEFTTPIDWASDPNFDEDWRNRLNSVVMADPFLQGYAQTKDNKVFREAVFFLLDWQLFYQLKKQTTDPAWRDSVVDARAARLAYVINERKLNTGLLTDPEFLRLVQLADFHVQRVQDETVTPVDGQGAKNSDGIKALCEVLNRLPSCAGLQQDQ